MDTSSILDRIREVSDEFARDRRGRQTRRELDASDFNRIRDTGFLLVGVPSEVGGVWEDTARSTRPVCEILRALAHGDSSVALVSSMHPAVLSFWLATPQAPAPFAEPWEEQRKRVSQSAADGSWWGTITSEPGSGGDVALTRATARLDANGAYRMSGEKHFGSGSGITAYMITSAVPEGEDAPDWFFLDMRDTPWDGSTGAKLVAPWDGHGMIATQSHGFRFDDFPATRVAWPGNWRAIISASGGFIGCCFTAVIVGIVETAVATARAQLERRRGSLRPSELVEWARADLEAWMILQVYEGMLRAMEDGTSHEAVVRGKTAIAELAESVLRRTCIVLGGGVYSRYSPFGFWFEDVRALGFLRPPWGLAFDRLIEESLSPTETPA
jgi:alkylation response protein AidB-like acyl-CoA dehydrogenase